MATLKEAVESGRRWRLDEWMQKRDRGPIWYGPGADSSCLLRPEDALRTDFEIEPEPEKPREWWIHPSSLSVCAASGNPSAKTAHAHLSGWFRVHDADACDRLHGKR